MSFEDFKKENCKNCNKECDCKIVRKIDGTVACVEEDD